MTSKQVSRLVYETFEEEHSKELKGFEEVSARRETGLEQAGDRHLLTEHLNFQRGMLNLAARVMEKLSLIPD